jgi:hypothetical protein
LDDGRGIIRELPEWFVRMARQQRPVERDGDLAEETKVVRQCRGVFEAGENLFGDPFLLKFDVIPIGSMRLREMFPLRK